MPASSESRLARAFVSLQGRKGFATGKEEFVLLNGKKKSALVSEITTDEAFISGGIAGGEFTCTIPQSIQPKEPEKFTPIEVRGKRLQVLSCVSRNGVTWEIVAGDPTSGQR
jgi:hypothetical protein